MNALPEARGGEQALQRHQSGSTAGLNIPQVMSPQTAQEFTPGMSADEELAIMLREHERRHQILSAEHLHQSQQVFRALQDPQQQQFRQAPQALTSSVSWI